MKKKSESRSIRRSLSKGGSTFASLRAVVIVICAATACLVLAGKLPAMAGKLALLHPEPTKVSYRPFTFAERVAYQRAIEEVYWRHRIWPRERPDPKPSLDAVMSQAQLENKVADYLRNSQALEDYWQQPVMAEQLQAEMDRMAEHTKQPEVLRELFEALGNDPFVIAECLARPVLTERLVADSLTQDKTGRFESARTKGLPSMSMAATLANVAYTLPKISEGDPPCIDDTWTPTSTTNAPSDRGGHTAVWTDSEMIVWGGNIGGEPLSTGGRYNPSTDSWTATSTTNAPTARSQHTAVWTGSEMIVWGGCTTPAELPCDNLLSTGGRYNPGTDSWTATSTVRAPAARTAHTAVWTGSEMIVWGGAIIGGQPLSTGGRYTPNTDSWTATSTVNAPEARRHHTAVWTGSQMIVWGGSNGGFVELFTGGRYNPNTDGWTATNTTNAPAGRESHTAVWTGDEMIVWGGCTATEFCVPSNTGSRYDPVTNSWIATSTANALIRRTAHTAVWTNSEMVVWGGTDLLNRFNTGGRYNPGTNSWTATSTINAPSARGGHTAVWTDSEMIVWGGFGDSGDLNTGGRYCAQSGPTPTPTATPRVTPRPRPTPHPRPSGTVITDQ